MQETKVPSILEAQQMAQDSLDTRLKLQYSGSVLHKSEIVVDPNPKEIHLVRRKKNHISETKTETQIPNSHFGVKSPKVSSTSSQNEVVFRQGDMSLFSEKKNSVSRKKDGERIVQAKSVHIRAQQRNGRKSICLIEGLPEDLNLIKILRYMRKMFSTNGTVLKPKNDPNKRLAEVIQLQGDFRHDAANFLLKYNICDKEEVVIHGF